MPNPPIPVPPGVSIAWVPPTTAVAGPQFASGNGGATANLNGGAVDKTSNLVLDNPCWSAIWGGFDLTGYVPPGATILNIFPVIESIDISCSQCVPFVQYGTTGNQLNVVDEGLGGASFATANPSSGVQVTLPNPAGGGITSGWDTQFQIGIQVEGTNSATGFLDLISAANPVFAVYYTGGLGVGAQVPVFSLISSGPSVPDDCLYESKNGRKIGTLVVDWTELPILGNGDDTNGSQSFSFPEFTYDQTTAIATTGGGPGLVGYQVLEADLRTAWGGLGLDEVRSVIILSRPLWQQIDLNGSGILGNACDVITNQSEIGVHGVAKTILSAVQTQQSILCGALASWLGQEPQDQFTVRSSMVSPFYLIGPSLKIRILNLLDQWDPVLNVPIPCGKYTFLFCNFDAPPLPEASECRMDIE
jgi:hypothetical protein